MVYKIMKDFEDRLELVPFDSNDISVGIKSYKELQRKRKVWEKYAQGCSFNSKTNFLTMHIKVDMPTSLL